MATGRTIGVYCVARLLVSVLRVDVVRTAAVPPRIRLHAASVAHSLGAADGPTTAVCIVAVAAGMAVVRIVSGVGVAGLVVAAVVAVSSAAIGAHDLALISACSLRTALVFAVDGGFEGADGVEGAFPSRARGVGEIWVDYDVSCRITVLEGAEGLERGLLQSSSDGLDLVHRGVGIGLCVWVVVDLALLALADFALVFGSLAGAGRMVAALVAVEAEGAGFGARTGLLAWGLLRGGRHGGSPALFLLLNLNLTLLCSNAGAVTVLRLV